MSSSPCSYLSFSAFVARRAEIIRMMFCSLKAQTTKRILPTLPRISYRRSSGCSLSSLIQYIRIKEDFCGGYKANTMLFKVDPVFFFIPFKRRFTRVKIKIFVHGVLLSMTVYNRVSQYAIHYAMQRNKRR